MPFKQQPALFYTWWSMRQRCENPKYPAFKGYGARGIYVCDRWKSFKTFESDMGPKPTQQHTLDRIDNDGPYSPDNCRWADRKVQQRNRRDAVYVVIEGVKYRAIELAEIANQKTDTIVERAAAGLSYDKVVSKERRYATEHLIGLGPAVRKRKAAAKTHCSKGHALTEANTYVTKQGWRVCKECHNAKMRRINSQKRALRSSPSAPE